MSSIKIDSDLSSVDTFQVIDSPNNSLTHITGHWQRAAPNGGDQLDHVHITAIFGGVTYTADFPLANMVEVEHPAGGSTLGDSSAYQWSVPIGSLTDTSGVALDLSSANGSLNITATAFLSVGNNSQASNTVTQNNIIIDTTAPILPTVILDEDSAVAGQQTDNFLDADEVGDINNNVSNAVFTVTGEPSSLVDHAVLTDPDGNPTTFEIVDVGLSTQDILVNGVSAGFTNAVENNIIASLTFPAAGTLDIPLDGTLNLLSLSIATDGTDDGVYSLGVQITDPAGNTSNSSAVASFTIDTAAPSVSFAAIEGNNIVNAQEESDGIQLTGSSTGLVANDTFDVIVKDSSNATIATVTATVGPDGASWTASINAGVVNDGTGYTLSTSTTTNPPTDAAGNTPNAAFTSTNFSVDTTAPSIDSILVEPGPGMTDAAGEYANIAEVAGGDINITGTATGLAPNETFDLALLEQPAGTPVLDGNGDPIIVTATADAMGTSWTALIDVSAAGTPLIDGDYGLTTVIAPDGDAALDAAGNEAIVVLHNFTLDRVAPTVTILGGEGTDFIVDPAENADANGVEFNGEYVENGSGVDNIVLTITPVVGAPFNHSVLAVDIAAGNWTANIPALTDGQYAISAVITDNAGNSTTTAPIPFTVLDPTAPYISIDGVSANADNYINIVEDGVPLTLSGDTGNISAGQAITVTFDGETYNPVVAADGTWSIPNVPAPSGADGDYPVTASHISGANQSQNVIKDTVAPTVAVSTAITGPDDTVDGIEDANGFDITGTSEGVYPGDVSVDLFDENGAHIGAGPYLVAVDADGNWILPIASNALSTFVALTANSFTVQVNAVDAAGNPAVEVNEAVSVDLDNPALSITGTDDNSDTGLEDGILNALELNQDLVIEGEAYLVNAGDTVTVQFGGMTLQTTIDAGATTWSLTITAAQMAAADAAGGFADGTNAITASVTSTHVNANGEIASDSYSISVSTAPPTVTIDAIEGDNVLNLEESLDDLQVSGTSNAPDGSIVNWTIEAEDNVGGTFVVGIGTATVTNGLWSATIDDDNVGGFGHALFDTQGANPSPLVANYIFTAAVTDPGGTTSASVSTTFEVDQDEDASGNDGAIPATISIDTPISVDGVIDSAEVLQPLEITGTSTGLEAGQNVHVTINGVTYEAPVVLAVPIDLDTGSWTVTIPAADVGALDILVPGNDAHIITATGEDVAGNPAAPATPVSVTVVTDGPAVMIDAISNDDIIDSYDAGEPITVSGTTFNVEAGQVVTLDLLLDPGVATAIAALTIPQQAAIAGVLAALPDTATVQADGTWSVTASDFIPDVVGDPATIGDQSLAEALTALEAILPGFDANGLYTITADVVNASGTAAQQAARLLTLDDAAPAVEINSGIAIDDIINAQEAGSPVTVSGISNGVASDQDVTVTVGGVEYTATVSLTNALDPSSGTWSVDIPAANLAALPEGDVEITAAIDVLGNEAFDAVTIVKDTEATIEISLVAGDDVVTAAELADTNGVDAGTGLLIEGTTTGVEENAVVELEIDGITVTAIVAADGSFSYQDTDFGGLVTDNYIVNASVTDDAGNEATDARPIDVNVDIPTVLVEDISDDSILNAIEVLSDLPIFGTTTGVENGQTVTVTFNGVEYTDVVADNSWQVDIPAADLAGLAEDDYTAEVSVFNLAGNEATTSGDVFVDLTTPILDIDPISSDNELDDTEVDVPLTITGSAGGITTGNPVTVKVNGLDYATTITPGNTWSVTLPLFAVQNLPDGLLTVTASSSEGNVPVETSDTLNVIAGNVGTEDTLIASLPVETLNGGLGEDLVTFFESSAGVQVDLDEDGNATGQGGYASGDTLTGIENLTGSQHDDNLSGNSGANVLNGLDGDDHLNGEGGDDVINGGANQDVLVGGAGNDELNGNSGNDYLYGQDGDDTLNGGAGLDVLVGGAGDDTLNGDEGFNYLYGGEGEDTANGGSGTDIAYGGDDNDDLNGNGGTDWLFGENGNDDLNGGSGSDLLFGGAGDDTINGGSGNDWLWGDDADATGGGADTFVFDANWGVDVIYDFENGVDTIDLSGTGLAFTDLNIGQIAGGFTYVADDTFTNFIYLDGGSSPLDATDLGVEDFMF